VRECMEAAAGRTKNMFRDLPCEFGCKTGTAHITSRFITSCRQDDRKIGTGDKYYLGSIGAYFPADKPKYTVFVSVCKESTAYNDYFGIDLSGPVAADIMQYLYTNDPSLHAPVERSPMPHAPKSIKGGDMRQTQQVARRFASHLGVEHSAQWCSVKVDEGGNATLTGMEIPVDAVPDVRGMGLKDALYVLERCGLEVSFKGAGRVTQQSVKAGTPLQAAHGKIRLTLER
ncbi:MAG: PASTA domain-containing protein, partial [Alistipes sp.]|nr:PASTA domain-containing protein [Alistipes sp.]